MGINLALAAILIAGLSAIGAALYAPIADVISVRPAARVTGAYPNVTIEKVRP